ncbi:MAG TPA: DinB family protein [Stackebrandtia sp.]|nr:DinB family protein [Stackebrandtia sp.]
MVRKDEPFVASERDLLQGYRDWQRDTLLHKCAGLTGAQLAEAAVPPSSLTLLGFVRHMANVERTWFRLRVAGEDVERMYPGESETEELDPSHAEADFQRLRAEREACDRAVADLPLTTTFQESRWGEMSLRWVYVHMIEEYARHNGHADLLRERIDGTVGT